MRKLIILLRSVLRDDEDVLRQTASPELPHVFQTAPVFGGNLYKAITIIGPDICEIHSFVLGQPGRRTSAPLVSAPEAQSTFAGDIISDDTVKEQVLAESETHQV